MNSLHAFTKHLFVVAFMLASFSSCKKEEEKTSPAERPNIIFIMSDDHAYQAISAYGGMLAELAPTPNIDRIAEAGMLFNNCFVTNSICGPSRATILTGQYSHRNGFIDNTIGSQFDFSQQSYAKILQQTGYKTATIGKLHLGGTPTGFDYYDILPGQGLYYNPVFINHTGEYTEEGYTTEIITEKSLAWLDSVQNEEQPFMLMMWHKAPHRGWQPGPNELGMYEDVTFPEPATLFDDYSGNRKAAAANFMSIAEAMRLEDDLKLSENPPGNMTEEQRKKWKEVYDPILKNFRETNPQGKDLVSYKYQRYMRDYLASVSAVDKSVGALLDYLKASGLDKNTIVIYSSDQGFYLGEHGWFDKRWMYDQSLKTPLLVSWPGVIQPGSVMNEFVSNLDFAETFIDIAGGTIPEDMQGKSLVPILKGETPDDWRDAHYYHYYEHPSEHVVQRHYGITTDDYKLIHFYYEMDEWELYDLKKDPQEMNNVYETPGYEDIQNDLHQKLEQLRTKYGDNDSLNQKFIEEYNEKVKKNPHIEYWKFSREELMKKFGGQSENSEESED